MVDGHIGRPRNVGERTLERAVIIGNRILSLDAYISERSPERERIDRLLMFLVGAILLATFKLQVIDPKMLCGTSSTLFPLITIAYVRVAAAIASMIYHQLI
ncbi:hypothetical protein SUGI_1113930 [Cryptomeria japonica]|nr:hypothetical protein SUGI_1113930 [Cryptomeria japonica]